MSSASQDRTSQEFLATLHVGDLCHGTVAEVTRSRGVAVTLDGYPAQPLGTVGPLDLTWRQYPATAVRAGQRITAAIIAIDLDQGQVQLSLAAAEHPELWAFLKPLRSGEILSGTVTAIERFGVFVDLDDGPEHPVLPGVGFITIPELAWHHFESATDIVRVGQHVSCEFLYFDTWNGEARLSLRATQPDPFQVFAATAAVGQTLHGYVTKVIPFGALVRVADGVEGLIHLQELAATPVEAPEDVVQVGDEVITLVIGIDRQRRKLALSRRQALHDSR
ncbi:S1 RNA-binding domain-containing protein [Streptacidiphilus sp. N1-12]|uniref:S1 RNA-binding domain-containing protein n=2 Tax=Streptacidiphilus alkalitolerans TaxID=3342712 RepID=A0ABV6W953_9ACTN